MTGREKRLALITSGIALLFVLVVSYERFARRPFQDAQKETLALQQRFEKLRVLEAEATQSADSLREWAARIFGDEPDEASARAGERLTEMIARSGLEDARFTRLPMSTPKSRRRGPKEISWSVQGIGPLKRVVDFLYVLKTDPYLHRIENLVVTPRVGNEEVAVNFRYLTLVIDSIGSVKRDPLPYAEEFEEEERKLYRVIIERDLFKPLIPPEPEPPPPPPPPPPPLVSSPGPENFRIVSLSQWLGSSEVVVMDVSKKTTRRYKVGETLRDGEIVAVDYRSRPFPGKPELQSHSRVILRVQTTYWAVEGGTTLAEKHQLAVEELPASLRTRVQQRRESRIKTSKKD